MKRLTSLVIMIAICLGMLPAAFAAEENPASWGVRYDGETGKAGYVDQNGDWVIQPQFGDAYPFDLTGYAVVSVYEPQGPYYRDSLYGLIDRTGAYVAEPIYKEISKVWDYDGTRGGRVFQSTDGTYGIMDTDGTILVPQVQGVDYLSYLVCGVVAYRLGEKMGLMDARGNKLTGAIYDLVYPQEIGYVEIREGDLKGIMALDGTVVLPPTYEDFSDYCISRPDLSGALMAGKWGLISHETGELVVPCAFDNTDDANVALALGVTSPENIYPACAELCRQEGLSVNWLEDGVSIMRRYGTDRMLLSRNGVTALYGLDGTAYTDYIFDVVGEFDAQGHALAMKGGKWGQIDLEGNTVVEFLYDAESEAVMGTQVEFVSKSKDSSPPYALARRDGSVLTDYKYWAYTAFSNGFAMVADGENWAYIDTNGKELTPFKYMAMGSQFGSTPFQEDGCAIVQARKDLKRNIIDSTGRELLPENYYKIWRAGCGLFGFQADSGVGFIDTTGKVVIEPQYGYSTDPKGIMQGNVFGEDGLASVRSNGVWITIDAQGDRVTEPQAKNDASYKEGLVPANYSGPGEGWTGGPWGFQNESGEWTVPQMFDAVGEFDHGYAAVRSMGRYGMLKNPLKKGDVSDWARAEVETAAEAGYVTESCAHYQTYTITRAQFASLAVNYLEKATGENVAPAPADTFIDTADEAVLKAYAAGIVQGVGEGRFAPDGALNREQLATMFWRAMSKGGVTVEDYIDLTAYTDHDKVSDWAVESVAALAGLKVMEGTGGGLLSPKNSCTVEQAILLVYRAAK